MLQVNKKGERAMGDNNSEEIVVEETEVYEPKRLFKMVNNQEMMDLTEHIVVPSYKVINKPQYVEWYDGDHFMHRDVQRYVLQGTFTLFFNNRDEYLSFLSFYNAAKVDDAIQAYVYGNNDDTVKLTRVFMDLPDDMANEMPFMGIKEIDGIEVTIKEK